MIPTPYGEATDYGDAVVRYVMHSERPPLELTQALRDEAESLRADRDALAEAVQAALDRFDDQLRGNKPRLHGIKEYAPMLRAALARVGR